MQLNIEELKALIEAGDKSAIEQHIFKSLEKGDVILAASHNVLVKSELDSEKDKHHNTALQTWKDNNLQTLIDEEVVKRNPQETPEQKRIRELEEKLQKQELDAKRSALKETALSYATDKGYDAKFATKYIEKFLADDETATNAALDELKTDLDAIVQAQVEETLKANSRSGAGGGSGSGGEETSLGKRLATENNNNKTKDAQDAFFG